MNKLKVSLTEEESDKFWKKFKCSFGEYRFAYQTWWHHEIRIIENFNNFGLPEVRRPPHPMLHEWALIKAFAEMEIKKSKNRRYKDYLYFVLETATEKIKENKIEREKFEQEMAIKDEVFAEGRRKEREKNNLDNFLARIMK